MREFTLLKNIKHCGKIIFEHYSTVFKVAFLNIALQSAKRIIILGSIILSKDFQVGELVQCLSVLLFGAVNDLFFIMHIIAIVFAILYIIPTDFRSSFIFKAFFVIISIIITLFIVILTYVEIRHFFIYGSIMEGDIMYHISNLIDRDMIDFNNNQNAYGIAFLVSMAAVSLYLGIKIASAIIKNKIVFDSGSKNIFMPLSILAVFLFLDNFTLSGNFYDLSNDYNFVLTDSRFKKISRNNLMKIFEIRKNPHHYYSKSYITIKDRQFLQDSLRGGVENEKDFFVSDKSSPLNGLNRFIKGRNEKKNIIIVMMGRDCRNSFNSEGRTKFASKINSFLVSRTLYTNFYNISSDYESNLYSMMFGKPSPVNSRIEALSKSNQGVGSILQDNDYAVRYITDNNLTSLQKSIVENAGFEIEQIKSKSYEEIYKIFANDHRKHDNYIYVLDLSMFDFIEKEQVGNASENESVMTESLDKIFKQGTQPEFLFVNKYGQPGKSDRINDLKSLNAPLVVGGEDQGYKLKKINEKVSIIDIATTIISISGVSDFIGFAGIDLTNYKSIANHNRFFAKSNNKFICYHDDSLLVMSAGRKISVFTFEEPSLTPEMVSRENISAVNKLELRSLLKNQNEYLKWHFCRSCKFINISKDSDKVLIGSPFKASYPDIEMPQNYNSYNDKFIGCIGIYQDANSLS